MHNIQLGLFLHSGVREDADGRVTYCLVGNGLSIVANEEYLTISSTLDPPHNPTTSLTTPNSQPSGSLPRFTAHNPSLGPHVPAASLSPLSLPPDMPTLCSMAQPLTTQPPKTTNHLVHQGLHSGHYEVKPVVPPPKPPPPPLTPITTQVFSSRPPCALTLAPTALDAPAHRHLHARDGVEKRDRDCDDEDDVDEEEEESRRKASLCWLEISAQLAIA